VCLSALLAIGLGLATPLAAEGDNAPAAPKERDACVDCPKEKPKYDSTEVIKTIREVDESKVVETESVVPSKRVIETNHLVIHENETRRVGTIEHRQVIIEKELVLTKRNVDHKYVDTDVDLVEHKYTTERRRVVEEQEVPGEVRHLRDCRCERPKALRFYRRSPSYVHSHH
jgi:hypothetical protein